MHQGAGQKENSEGASTMMAVASQGGDYQKYMKQYAGNYSQQGGSKGGGGAQGGGYQKYMKQYAGDYSKYTGGKSSQGGDYQQYMKKYAGDYSKYMHQGAGQKENSEGASTMMAVASQAG